MTDSPGPQDRAAAGAEPAAPPRIWVLLGGRRGDNNQLLALAEALGRPFETRSLRYLGSEPWRTGVGKVGLDDLDEDSRRAIAPPWPDLVIGVGWRSVPVARHIAAMSEGRTRLVRVGNPRCDPALFDLVLTTAQYPVPPGPTVELLPLAMSRFASAPEPTAAERALLDALPRPHLLMTIGGETRYWTVRRRSIAAAAVRLAWRAWRAGGSLLIATSPRTGAPLVDAARKAERWLPNCSLVGSGARFDVLLADADECFVTGDSVSMLSEALLTGKPTGMIPISLSRRGRKKITRTPDSEPALIRRDLRRFWRDLQKSGQLGTIARPRVARLANPAGTAASSVLEVLAKRLNGQ